MGRDHHDLETVDRLELVGLGIRGTGHAGELLVHAEQVLERDRGEGLVLALDRHAFLGFDGLVQAIGPASPRERAAGEFVDDDDLAVAHDVVHITLVDRVGAQCRIEVMDDRDVLGVVQALVLADDAFLAQQLFGVLHALLGQVHLLLLLVDVVVARLGRLARLAFLFLSGQARHDPVDLDIQLRRLVGRTRDDQRRARFVDQDRIDLVYDRVVQAALVALFLRLRHVVAQIVEAEFVVGAVGDVGGIRGAFVAMFHARPDHADSHAEEPVDLAHPGRVALGEIVVDGDDVHALAFQGVEIDRQCRDQGLALAGAHFGNLARVQNHAADQLHVVGAQPEHPARGLAHGRERFRQQTVQRGPFGEAPAKLFGPGTQLLVRQRLHFRFQRVDPGHRLAELAQDALVAAAENARHHTVEHGQSSVGKRDAATLGAPDRPPGGRMVPARSESPRDARGRR